MLAVTEINGMSHRKPVPRSVFGSDYTFSKSFPAPNPAKGVNIGVAAVKFGANGKVVSNQVNIDL